MRHLLLVAACVIATVVSGAAAVKVKVNLDKMFDFRQAQTWAWATPIAGHVLVARTPTDDPEAIQKLAEPVIMEAVIGAMAARGMSHTIDEPAVTLKYYLVLTVGTSAQTLGQFLPVNAQFGIPYFSPSTQSLKIIQQGSLIIDASAKGEIVWRGMGEAEIKPGMNMEKRAALIRVAVRDILKKYPENKSAAASGGR
jgi:hypothetical protein